MIKDEYFNVNDCNNLSLDFGEISNLTHDHYEYEQAQGDIIVKSRLKKTLQRLEKYWLLQLYFRNYAQWVHNTYRLFNTWS